MLAAVGQLQFEVFAHRLGSEFGAPIELSNAPYVDIRLTDEATAERLRRLTGIKVMKRGDGSLVALFESSYRLARLMADEPELTLTPLVATGT